MKSLLIFFGRTMIPSVIVLTALFVVTSLSHGQYILQGGLAVKQEGQPIVQAVYSSATPKTEIRQTAHRAPQIGHAEPMQVYLDASNADQMLVEPMPLVSNYMTSNSVVELSQPTTPALSKRYVKPQTAPKNFNETQRLPRSDVPGSVDNTASAQPRFVSERPQFVSLPPLQSQYQLVSHPEPPSNRAVRHETTPLPRVVTSEHTEKSVRFPEAAPMPFQDSAGRKIATEMISRVYRLQNISTTVLERKLIDKLGQRFVPVRNVEATSEQSRFRLPVQDGTDVELSIDHRHGSATVSGSTGMVGSTLQIVRLLDVQEDENSYTTEFLPVQRANIVSVRQAANIVNRESQKDDVGTALKLAQNNQTFQPGVDQPAAQFTAPAAQAGQPNTQIDAAAREGGGIVGPVQIDIVDGLDMMFIRGPAKDVAAIKIMLDQIEAMSLEHEPVLELVPMLNADSSRVSQMVQQLYSQVYLSRRGSITILPLIKPNTILLIGKKESVDTAKDLIARLDTPVSPESEFLIARLKNASSDSLQTQLTTFYANRTGLGAQVLVVSDARTNSLVVQGSPRDLVEVETMLRQLDTPGSDAQNTVKTFPLKNAMASELATTLQNAISGTSTTGTGGFSSGGGGGATQSGRTRNPQLVELGTVDAQGNLLRANVLYDVRITADTRSNSLIVSAPSESMPLIETLIKQLDQLPSAESQIKVFTMVNGDASSLVTVLQNLFATTSSSGGGFGGGTSQSSSQIATVRPGIEEGESTLVSVRFQVDTRTNSIIACGSAGDMSVVEALLLRLDEENMNNRKVMVFKLLNSPASEIAAAIQTYVSNERQLEIQNSSTFYPQSPIEQYRKEVVVVAESISNTLIVSTTPRFYNQIRKIIMELDERPLMVAIQVLIAEVKLTNNKERGMEIGLQDSLLFDRSVLSNGVLSPGFLFGDPAQGLPTENVNSGTVGSQGITSLGVGRVGSNGYGGFTFSASSESVSVLVRALEEQGRLQILSRPHVTTLHNLRATIQIGQKVPYVNNMDSSNYSTTSSVEFIDVGTILDVTPRITPDGMVIMDLYAEKSSTGSKDEDMPIGSSGGVPLTVPRINLTKAQTTVSAMDGQTIVFAGLITDSKDVVHRSIPFLNKIPIVKHFFEFKSTYRERSEMLIVMTPTIIRNEMDMDIIRQQEASRMHWCVSDVVKLTKNSKMRLREDEWRPCDAPFVRAQPIVLDDSMLPSEDRVEEEQMKIKFPVPVLAPPKTGSYE